MSDYSDDIRKKMAEKSPDELCKIWYEKDYDKFTQEEFDVVHDILVARGLMVEKSVDSQKKEGGFFSFRKMITPSLIKIVYVLGMIAIIISGIVFLILKAEGGPTILALILPLFGVVVLNIIWRIVCEGVILAFSAHEVLVSIEKKLKR